MKESKARKTDVESDGDRPGLLGTLSKGMKSHFDILSRSLTSSFGSMTFKSGVREVGSSNLSRVEPDSRGRKAQSLYTSNRVTPGEE